ncbi:MAG: hypothetical protein KAR42_16180 [candidate division Zixibacteria bacterium]|nr:hypothetical protein [candidate division Zixibacteria bacterium]
MAKLITERILKLRQNFYDKHGTPPTQLILGVRADKNLMSELSSVTICEDLTGRPVNTLDGQFFAAMEVNVVEGRYNQDEVLVCSAKGEKDDT